MKLLAMIFLGCVTLFCLCEAAEKPQAEASQEYRQLMARKLRDHAISELKKSQHVAICAPLDGKGHVIEKVLKGEAGVDHVGQLRVGEPWNKGGFPMQRIVVYEQLELGDVGKQGGTIAAIGFYPIDAKGRLEISKETGAYLDLDELAKILAEDRKPSGKESQFLPPPR